MLDRAGDRVGLAVGSLNSKTLERGVVAAPGAVRPVMAAIAVVIKVRRGGNILCDDPIRTTRGSFLMIRTMGLRLLMGRSDSVTNHNL